MAAQSFHRASSGIALYRNNPIAAPRIHKTRIFSYKSGENSMKIMRLPGVLVPVPSMPVNLLSSSRSTRAHATKSAAGNVSATSGTTAVAALVASMMLSAPASLAAAPDAVAQQTLVESMPFGAVFGILGLAAAVVSYSSQGKLRDELAIVQTELKALTSTVEALQGEATAGFVAKEPEKATDIPVVAAVQETQEKVAVTPVATVAEAAEAKEEAGAVPESFWIDVPTDCFGGVSPERKAADALSTLVTSVSVRTIMAQEKENDGESKVFTGLTEAVQNPMRSTERWIANLLMDKEYDMQSTGVRILTMRLRYAEGQFDWAMLQSLSAEGLVEERKRLQEKYQVEGVPDDMEFIEESAEKMAPAANAPQEKGEHWIEVPTDAFGGLIPEQKAADALRNLFTFVAVRAIMAQEEGFDGSGQSKVYKDLVDAVQTPIQKSEEWIGNLMENGDNEMKLAAVKILAIREQYVTRQFDWKTVNMWATEGLKEEKQRLCERHPVIPPKKPAVVAAEESEVATEVVEEKETVQVY